jgi:3-isopropylmalate dehydrogenase
MTRKGIGVLKIAIIGGDGIGPEVVAEGLKTLAVAAEKTGLKYTTRHYDVSGARYLAAGGDPAEPSIPVISDEEIEELRGYDAIYLGAVGHPDIAPGILEQGLLLKLRFRLDQYINLRPVKLYPGVSTPLAGKGPKDIDFTVIRENTEGLYCGTGGVVRHGTAGEISTQEMITTRFGVERCLRYAFETARRGKAAGRPGQLTLVHKTNVLTHCGGTWFRAFEEIGQADYPDIKRNYNHVDACCMYMATCPEIYDVIVVPNMFGDIITDLGAAISGGMGMAASGNLNPDPASGSVSMFEPVHGSAPDIAGQNKANPIAAICSMSMLLSETGRIVGNESAVASGAAIDSAVRNVCPKFEGRQMDRMDVSTSQVGDMIADTITAKS